MPIYVTMILRYVKNLPAMLAPALSLCKSPLCLCLVFLLALLSACRLGGNEAPVVSVILPEANAVFSKSSTIRTEALALDADGDVARVTFFVNGIGRVDTSPPYALDLKAQDLGDGSHTLSVRAYDDEGASSAPALVRFSVGERFRVNTAVTGSGIVTSSPAGLSCSSSCTAEFSAGTSVSLSAAPANGASFQGWGGDCAGTGTCTVAKNANVTATFAGTASVGPDEAFTLVFLPDTQSYVCSVCRDNDSDADRWRPEIFRAQTQWVANNAASENIAFVANGGDIIEKADRLEEWQIADAAYDMIGGVVPYSVIPGDHDYYPEEYRDGDTTYYRQFFGAERYRNDSWYGGASPSGLSHYQRFTGGGQDFIHIGLEFEAPGPVSNPNSALGWAKAILEANPNTPTLISTHEYLKDKVNRRSLPSEQEACYKPGSGIGTEPCRDKPGTLDPNASSGEEIFQALIAPYPQVFMVLGGHYYRSDTGNTGPTSDNGEYHQVSTNNAGAEVFEMLANYQAYDNGGDGWMRLIKFLPEGGANGLDRIQVRTYSPTRDAFQPGSASNFSFDLDFAERFGNP